MTVRYYSSVAAETTLVASITNANTSIQIASATGLPALTPFTLALDYEAATEELVEVTAVAGTTLTITRGIDGTSAASHNAGARVRHVSSARDFSDSRTHENTSTNVHGLAVGSAVVGTNDTQTLSNKTLNNANGTLNRIDIFAEGGTSWVTTVNGDIDHAVDLMKWYRGPSEAHEVSTVTNNGAHFIRNQNAAADSTFNTYRLRVTKDDGTTDIFSVLSGGTATAWTNSGQTGFQVKPRTSDNNEAIRVRNTADSASTFSVWNNGRVDVNGSDPAFSQLDVHGASGQSAAIMRVMNNDETSTYFTVTSSGNVAVEQAFTVNSGATTLGGGLDVTAGSVSFPLESPAGSITAASGFSLVASNVKKVGDVIYALVVIERTGANLTGGVGAGLGDVDAFTLPAAMRPNSTYGTQSLPFAYTDGFTHGTGRVRFDTGVYEIVTLAEGGVLQSGRNIRVFMSYPA